MVIVIGACDVINPAAIDVAGTPISGMPILMAHKARNVICCNFDDKPGYSGVNNPLYQMDHVVMMAGDARQTLARLIQSLESLQNTAPPAN
jgi:NAD(P) transhydrogenase subunit beta